MLTHIAVEARYKSLTYDPDEEDMNSYQIAFHCFFTSGVNEVVSLKSGMQ